MPSSPDDASSALARASDLAEQADQVLGDGDQDGALRLYAAAARATEVALVGAAPTSIRTVNLLTSNAVALWLKAEQFREAERVAVPYLGRAPDAPLSSRLRGWLVEAWQGQLLAAEAQVRHIVPLDVHIEGSGIHLGLAPADAISDRQAAVPRLLWRCAEYLTGQDYRHRGEPDAPIRGIVRAFLAAPMAASYMLRFRVGQPTQTEMPFSSSVGPATTSDGIVRRSVALAQQLAEDPDSLLADEDITAGYRTAFATLVSGLAPSGPDVDRVTIGGGRARRVQATLTPETRKSIQAARGRVAAKHGVHEIDGSIESISSRSSGRTVTVGIRSGSALYKASGSSDEFEELALKLFRQPVVATVASRRGSSATSVELRLLLGAEVSDS